MKFFRSFLGYMIAGVFVMSVWDGLVGAAGIFGGYLAAIILIGPLWFMNHYLNLVDNKDGVAFVDMGLAIGVCGIFRDAFIHGGEALTSSLPTIGIVALGAIAGGLVATAIERDMAKDLLEEPMPEPGATKSEEVKLNSGGL